MKLKSTTLILVAIFMLALGGCKKGGNMSGLKNVTGRAGEMVVVISNEVWNGIAGDTIKALLAQAQYGLPQIEPVFNIAHVPQEAFGDIFKTSRNLIITQVSSSVTTPEVKYQNNVFANTQAVVTITAKDAMEFTDIFVANSDKIMGFFLKAERNRLVGNYNIYFEKSIKETLSEKFDLTLNVAPGFVIAENRDNFIWLRFETPEISQGIFVYEMPYESDSTFTVDYLMGKRLVTWRNNVPGPRKGSYMTQEAVLPALFNTLKYNGNFAAETRGLWTLENDYMGGPYVSLAVLDMLKQRVIMIEGYVYAPSKNKRNLIRQVEGMMYTLKFNKQADIDKINKQFEISE